METNTQTKSIETRKSNFNTYIVLAVTHSLPLGIKEPVQDRDQDLLLCWVFPAPAQSMREFPTAREAKPQSFSLDHCPSLASFNLEAIPIYSMAVLTNQSFLGECKWNLFSVTSNGIISEMQWSSDTWFPNEGLPSCLESQLNYKLFGSPFSRQCNFFHELFFSCLFKIS